MRSHDERVSLFAQVEREADTVARVWAARRGLAGPDLDDAKQQARLFVWDRTASYREGQGATFDTYALAHLRAELARWWGQQRLIRCGRRALGSDWDRTRTLVGVGEDCPALDAVYARRPNDGPDIEDEVRFHLRCLPAELRVVVEMVHLRGMPQVEAAKSLGLVESSVSLRLKAAMITLRENHRVRVELGRAV